MRRVVVIGGGYAGLHAFKAMSSRLPEDVEVKLISRDGYHTYHGWTGEVLSGRMPVSDTLSDLRGILGNAFVQGTVEKVDLDLNEVLLADGRAIDYDQLLIAIGSKDPLDALPGAREHAWRLKDSHDMQAFRQRLDAGPLPKRVVVIGGGPAGVEAASALALRYGSIVTLVSGRSAPLAHLDRRFPKISAHARSLLTSQGVAVLSGARATEVHGDRVVLEDGRSMDADMVVVSAGIALPVLPGTETLPRNGIGQILVDDCLRVKGMEDVWAAGDVAAVARPGRPGEACPVDALWAMKQGACAGHNMLRELDGRSSVPFSFGGMGQAAGLGLRDGISELHGLQFTGKLAWLLRIGFFAWYMPYRVHGFRVLKDLLIGGRPAKQIASSPVADRA